MTRRPIAPRARRLASAALLLAGALATPVAAPLHAQVGHTPAESPYEDLRGRHGITFAPGFLAVGGDPAGVGPRSGPMFAARYEYFLTGPLWFISRVAYAPSLERTVKDPEVAPNLRIVGTDTDPLVLLDAGLALNFTGNKSWRRLAPRLHGNLGLASTFNGAYDVGGYRFGTKFVASYGVGTRIVTGQAWEFHADLTHMLWKMSYPDSYGGDGSPSDDSIIRGGRLGPWQGSALLSFGITRYLSR